jgi:hypothetical protein
LQIFKSPELFLYPTPEGNVWINPHNTVQTQRERERERERENLSTTVADPDKANSIG